MNDNKWIKKIKNRELDNFLLDLYGVNEIDLSRNRYINLINEFNSLTDRQQTCIISTPGRTELGGNHTDHNNGLVIAASIHLDALAAAAPSPDNKIIIYSRGYKKAFKVNLSKLDRQDNEKGTTNGIIRGIASGLSKNGFKIGGFNAYIDSNVLPGSGLSSSACIEILIGSIFNKLYNNNKIPELVLAQQGQYAENNYFGKPCGLMDQIACSFGGIVHIDFKNNNSPDIKKIHYNFIKNNFNIVIINTGGSHSKLTKNYTAIPMEMKNVSKILGKTNCREIDYKKLTKAIPELRKKAGDRAILRCMHFIKENQRVNAQINALKNNNIQKYLSIVIESGNSSWKYLQNCYAEQNPGSQGISLALALTEEMLTQNRINTLPGACRVHGGGFEGTIQAYIKTNLLEKYTECMKSIFGKDAVTVLRIRKTGPVCYDCKD